MKFYLNPSLTENETTLEELEEKYRLPILPVTTNAFLKFIEDRDPYGNVLSLLPPSIGATRNFVKMIEVLHRFSIIEPTSSYLCFFNGCSADVITSIHHWWSTNYSFFELEWYACNDIKGFRDERKYYAKYPAQWLMNPPSMEGIVLTEETGDMNDQEEIARIGERLHGVNLYVSTNIDNKPRGYYEAAMVTLAPGGNLILRVDTLLNNEVNGIVNDALVSFEEVYVFKPYTSLVTDPEVYLVALHFEERRVGLEGLLLEDVISKLYGLRMNYTHKLIEALSDKTSVDKQVKDRESSTWIRTHALRPVKNPL